MQNINQEKFQELDELSEKKVPFFFMIDFLMGNVLIFNEQALKSKKILVDFPSFKNAESKISKKSEILWKSHPKSKENYQKGQILERKIII